MTTSTTTMSLPVTTPMAARAEPMRALLQSAYGGTEVLRLGTTATPTPAEGEVLVEVHAEEGTRVRARLGDTERVRFNEYVTG